MWVWGCVLRRQCSIVSFVSSARRFCSRSSRDVAALSPASGCQRVSQLHSIIFWTLCTKTTCSYTLKKQMITEATEHNGVSVNHRSKQASVSTHCSSRYSNILAFWVCKSLSSRELRSGLETLKDPTHQNTSHLSVLQDGEASFSPLITSSFLLDLFPHWLNHYLTGLLCLSKTPKLIGVTLVLLLLSLLSFFPTVFQSMLLCCPAPLVMPIHFRWNQGFNLIWFQWFVVFMFLIWTNMLSWTDTLILIFSVILYSVCCLFVFLQ